MSFVQIVSFRTDHADELGALDQEWFATTRGRNTVLDQRMFVDRHDPRHHVVLVEFADDAAAKVNSELPETGAFAARLTELADGPVDYLDLEPTAEADVRHSLAAGLRHAMRVSFADPAVFAADCGFTGYWPHEVVRTSGLDALGEGLRAEAPGRDIERWDVVTTEHGFAVEYAYRTHGETSYLSVGLVLATVDDGLVSQLTVTCGGSWDADAEARILGATAGASA
jgi:quinol monooxygenase YgiN